MKQNLFHLHHPMEVFGIVVSQMAVNVRQNQCVKRVVVRIKSKNRCFWRLKDEDSKLLTLAFQRSKIRKYLTRIDFVATTRRKQQFRFFSFDFERNLEVGDGNEVSSVKQVSVQTVVLSRHKRVVRQVLCTVYVIYVVVRNFVWKQSSNDKKRAKNLIYVAIETHTSQTWSVYQAQRLLYFLWVPLNVCFQVFFATLDRALPSLRQCWLVQQTFPHWMENLQNRQAKIIYSVSELMIVFWNNR